MSGAFAKDDIGLGVIGLGMGGCCFVVNEMPESTMRIRGLCDTNEALLADVARRGEVPFATTDYRELVARHDIDVVGVFSPDPLHAEHVLGALEAGKHVVCTKPMVTSLTDAQRILATVRRTGLKFLVGQTCRFVPAYMAARELVEQGRYGRLLYVEATYNHDLRDTFDLTPWRWQMPQDFLYGALCHPMDLAMWIGGRIARVSAFASCSEIDDRYPRGVLDNYVVNLEFANGALGRVVGMYSFVHPQGMPYIDLTVAGSAAGSHQGAVTWEPVPGQRTVQDIEAAVPQAHAKVDYEGHSAEVARYLLHLEDCLRRDAEPTPGALEATRVIAALEAVRESAMSGRAVEVEWDL